MYFTQNAIFEFLDSIEPQEKHLELLALSMTSAANIPQPQADRTLALLRRINTRWSEFGKTAFERLITQAMCDQDPSRALHLYTLFKERKPVEIPSAGILAPILRHWGIQGRPEMALKEHTEAVAKGMLLNTVTHVMLLIACSRTKRLYPQTIDLLRQMDLHRMAVNIRVYDALLKACSKAGDLQTAWKVFEHVQRAVSIGFIASPSIHTFTNMLWCIAGTETKHNKLSVHRTFCYDLDPKDMLSKAMQLRQMAESYGLKLDSTFLAAYLAAIGNHGFIDHAERVFWNDFTKYGVPWSEGAVKNMLRIYDAPWHIYPMYGSMLKVLEALPMDMKLSSESCRACIRIAALTDHLDHAVALLRDFYRRHEYRPKQEDLKHLRLRLIERERQDLLKVMEDYLVKEEKVSVYSMKTWRERAKAIDNLMNKAYGKKHKDKPHLVNDNPKMIEQLSSKQ